MNISLMVDLTMFKHFFSLSLLALSLTTTGISNALTFQPLQATRTEQAITITAPTSLVISKYESTSPQIALSHSTIVQEAQARFLAAHWLDTSFESDDYYRIGEYEEYSFTLPTEPGAPIITITIGATIIAQTWNNDESLTWEFDEPSIDIQLPDTITHQAIGKYDGLPLLATVWLTKSYKIMSVQKLGW